MIYFIIPSIVLVVTLWRSRWGILGIILLWPSYLLRTEILHIPTTVLELSLYAVLVGCGIRVVLKKDRWQNPNFSSTTWWLISSWIGAWLISTVFASDRQTALGALKAWLIDPLLFILLLRVQVSSTISRLDVVKMFVLSGTIVATYGLYQYFFEHSTLQGGRLSSFFHPVANYAAMYLGPILLVGLGAVTFKILSPRWLFPIGLMVAALLASLSYGAFLAVAVGAVAIWWKMPQQKLRKLLPVVLGGTALLFVAFLSTTANFREHFNRDRSSGIVRTQIWVTSWALIRQHPVVGIGPNNFERAYRKEIPKHYYPPLEWLVAQPHNLYLALWLETGILGLAVFLVSLSVWLKRTLTSSLQLTEHYLYAGISAAAVIAILVHGFVDTPVFKNDLAMMLPVLLILPWLDIDRKQSA